MGWAGLRKVGRRRSSPGERRVQFKAFPAPVAGWVTAENLSQQRGASARILVNWFPNQTGIRMRAGSRRQATCSGDGAPVESLMSYIGWASRRMFAGCDGSIFDVTTPSDPTEIETPVVTGQTANYYSFVNFATAGSQNLLAVNGFDPMLRYDGTDWSQITDSSTPISITGVDTAEISHISVYRNRIYMTRRGSMEVYFLGTNQMGGAAGLLNLTGVFGQGGSVLLTATWSMDAGDGLDDKFVVVSTEGEVAVYQGSDPADPQDWSLVGRYDITPPMGSRAVMHAGGDLVVATLGGLVPISAAVTKDPAALSLAAVSRAIEPDWVATSSARRTLPWEVTKWPEKNMAMVTTPVTSALDAPECFVVNLETGAWAKFDQWNTRCSVLHNGWLYFGTDDGRVMQAEVGGTDDGAIYQAVCSGAWDHLGTMGPIKTISQARATFRTRTNFLPRLSVSTNYEVTLPAAPNALSDEGLSGLWDTAIWDQSLWDSGASDLFNVSTRWVSIGRSGYVMAPQVQVSSGANRPADCELVEMTVSYETGSFVN